jgi:hypothetical protein
MYYCGIILGRYVNRMENFVLRRTCLGPRPAVLVKGPTVMKNLRYGLR